jgi:hypothetical protein
VPHTSQTSLPLHLRSKPTTFLSATGLSVTHSCRQAGAQVGQKVGGRAPGARSQQPNALGK